MSIEKSKSFLHLTTMEKYFNFQLQKALKKVYRPDSALTVRLST